MTKTTSIKDVIGKVIEISAIEQVIYLPTQLDIHALGNLSGFDQTHVPLAEAGTDELIAAGYRPGPRFKEMLEAAEDAQLEGRVVTTEEGMAVVVERFGEPSGRTTF